ncbi:MAG: RbsD or FucU transport, partial [Chloroflexi bacterium]|nr:RbsD or FucU transport [Chloroflexota bacterium]
MLKYTLTHPEILAALGTAGHGSQILIADGNYPFTTGSSPTAKRVYLNLTRGFAPV